MIQIKIKRYGLSNKGKVQVSTNLKKLKELAQQISNGLFPSSCEIFDYDTGETIKVYLAETADNT